MQSLSFLFRRRDVGALLSASLLWILNTGLAPGATNTPTITRQPLSSMAGVGENVFFNLEAAGIPPLRYQWYFEGLNLSGATNASLLLTNVNSGQMGYYYAKISNTNGSVYSDFAWLEVQTVFTRRLTTGRVLTNSSSPQVAVPIVLRGNGWENTVSFSLAYNPGAFANPIFLPAYANEIVTTGTSVPGLMGVSVMLPKADQVLPGYITLGLVQFDLAAGANALQGALAFTNSPIPITGTNLVQKALHLSAAVEPQHSLVASAPQLDRQSGLFKQQIIISNPGAGVMTNVNVLPATLGHDSLGHHISFYNGVSTLTNYPYGDPLVPVGRDCGCGFALDSIATNCDFGDYLACATNTIFAVDSGTIHVNFVYAQIHDLAPAESRTLTLEYYVSDHRTVPPAVYSVYLAEPLNLHLPDTVTPLTITTNRYLNGTYLIEFPTQTNFWYYVQYDSNPNFTTPLTAFPPVEGTGSRVQWIDDGPPKTVSPPVNGSRFYRVFQSP